MVDQIYSSAGDKYRVTLINISGVEHWWDPSRAPRACKKKSILVVPSTYHVKMRDIDIETRCWNKDFSYQDSNGELHEFREGAGIGKILRAWVEALLEFHPEQRKDILEHLEIWGQPKAWTDEKIAVDTIELIAEMYQPQAVVLCDCLGSQWI